MNNIIKLCEWYETQCNDEWEHGFGVRISTLDNPGWSLKVDLEGTPLADATFEDVKRETSDRNWIVARRSGKAFEAFGGPMNLDEMIGIFLSWAERFIAADKSRSP